MWNALFFWSDIFLFWDSVFLGILKNLFSAVWAFHVYSCLSGCGMPYFFLVRHFSILGLSIFFKFFGLFENCFFQLFGHFMSTRVWAMRNALLFFWSDIFLFWDSVFLHIFGDIKKRFAAVLTFYVYSCLSGCGTPYFFWLDIWTFFLNWGWDIWIFFQLFGHFVSTHFWADAECHTFFLVLHFFIVGLRVSVQGVKSLGGHFA